MREFESVVVVGLGYIGLPTAAVIASRGIKVTGVDTKEDVVKTVASGAIHISEPDLDGLVQKVVSNGTLVTASKPVPADVFIIAVPTPIDDQKKPDLSMVNAAVESIIDLIAPGNLIVLESTSPIGTTDRIAALIGQRRPDLRIGVNGKDERSCVSVAYCPERVLPGRILTELVNNDRCLGGVSPSSTRVAQRFYKTFVRGACVATTAKTAELVKLAENAYRDVNIAFANEMSLICDRHEISVWEVIDLSNRHPRVNILKPGAGVGGHCIAVDPWFIVDSAPDIARMIRVSREVNENKTDAVFDQVDAVIGDHPYANIACCGLAYKPNVDDLRESPALKVAVKLAEKYGSRLKVVEPNVRNLPPALTSYGVELLDIDDAVRACEIAVVLVSHDEFKLVPLAERRHLNVIDTCGIWQDMPVRS